MKMPTGKEAYEMSGLDAKTMTALEKTIRALPQPFSNSGRTAMEAFVQWNLMALVEVNNFASTYTGFKVAIKPEIFSFRSFDAEESERIQEHAISCQEAYLDAVQAHEPFTDILAPLFAVFLGGGEKNACQHFTPWAMAMAAARSLPAKKSGVCTIGDPTCGAGTMLLAHLRHWFEIRGAKDSENDIIIAGDKDSLCAAMTALQLMATQSVFGLKIGEITIAVEDAIRRDGFIAFHSMMNGRRSIAHSEEDSEEEAHA